jgi:hypothetical protein|tara:strand:+ start:5077 stop:5298 length:222 start_codon:yes stop_codon:yes gene_type:complete
MKKSKKKEMDAVAKASENEGMAENYFEDGPYGTGPTIKEKKAREDRKAKRMKKIDRAKKKQNRYNDIFKNYGK